MRGVRHCGRSLCCSISLPLLLVFTVLLQTPPPVAPFGQGSQILANFRLYCNRRASQRFPIHANDARCGGLCQPKNDVRGQFAVRVNATSYSSQNVQVTLQANPSGGSFGGNNIRGFAVIAMTDDETIVGTFSEQSDTLVASCDPMTEGDTVFHAYTSSRRPSVTLTWQPNSRNFGRIHFRAWIVVQHFDVYVLDSDSLENEISGSEPYDVEDNFYTFILNVFNISRSDATILGHQGNQTHSSSNGSARNTSRHVTNNQQDNVSGTDNQREIATEHTQTSTNSQTPQPASTERVPSSANSSGDGNFSTSNGTTGSSESSSSSSSGSGSFSARKGIGNSRPTSTNPLFETVDIGGGRSIAVRRTSQAVSDILGRFTTTEPPADNIPDDRTASVRFDSSSSSSSRSSSRRSNTSDSRSTSRGGSASINSSSHIRTNSSTVRFSITLPNGHSRELTLPSLTSFEGAFQRRLMTTGYDISADDPLHQVKREVPTFSDLFPQPLPASPSVLSDSSSLSSRNPFFQVFGSSPTPARSPNPLSPNAPVRQPFGGLLSTINSRFTPATNQFGGVGSQFGQPGRQTNFGFPTNTDFIQRPNSNAGSFGDFGTRGGSGGGFPFSNSRNDFQTVGTNGQFPGNQFTQQFNGRNPTGIFGLGTSFGRNSGFAGGTGGSLFSRFQQNSFPNRNAPSPFAPFPNSEGFNPGGVFPSSGIGSNGFGQQNARFGSLQLPNSGNDFRGQQNFQPSSANGFFTGQLPGTSFPGQQNGLWSRAFAQQLFNPGAGQQNGGFGPGAPGFPNSPAGQRPFSNPFTSSTSPQNSFAPNPQSSNNFFTGNGGFQSGFSSTNQFSGSFPTSSASLFGGIQNGLNRFSNSGAGNVWDPSSFNPVAFNSLQTGLWGSGRSFNPLASSERFGARFSGQNRGPLSSNLFSNGSPFSAG